MQIKNNAQHLSYLAVIVGLGWVAGRTTKDRLAEQFEVHMLFREIRARS